MGTPEAHVHVTLSLADHYKLFNQAAHNAEVTYMFAMSTTTLSSSLDAATDHVSRTKTAMIFCQQCLILH